MEKVHFFAYPSITNSYAQEFVDKCKSVVPDSEPWVMTEKIHGCNFVIFTDGVDIELGRRNSFLGQGENFHDSDKLREQYKEAILKLHVPVNHAGPIAIYGERFSGLYPHPDVKVAGHFKPIQKGIYYAPDYHFQDLLTFDVEAFTTRVPEMLKLPAFQGKSARHRRVW